MIDVVEPDRRGNAAGRATRHLIIGTAERLFADRGIDAVSLREIVQETDQGNVAAVQFHFGNKAGLIDAIIDSRRDRTEQFRLELLEQVRAVGAPTIRDLVEVIILPIAEHVADPEDNWISFQARLKATGTLYGHSVTPTPGLMTLQKLLCEALPQCPPSVIDRRLAMIIDWAVQSLAMYERSVLSGAKVMPLETAVEDLVELLSAALQARPI